MMHDQLDALRADYRALRAPGQLNEAVRQRMLAKRARPRRWLALAASLVAVTLLLLWQMPTPVPVQSADHQARAPRPSMSLRSPSSVAVDRPTMGEHVRRPPRFSTLRTPPRPTRNLRKKDQRHVQS